MPYTDQNTPVIQRISLPSGNSYYIADRQIRDVVEALSDTVAGGVSYMIGWDGTGEPSVGNIPAGVTVTYNDTEYTGILAANNATPGAFYLVKSGTSAPDIYSEYVPVGAAGNKTWEKLGDTQIDLTDIVTGVSLDKQTASVIGANSTFTITQPTVALATDSNSGDGKVEIVTGISSASASGDSVTALTGLGDPSTTAVLTGVQVTSQPEVTLTANSTSDTDRITYVQAQGTATTTKISANASGGAVSASGDNVTALTGLGTASTKNAIGADSTFTITQPTIALASNNTTATGRVEVATGSGTSSSTNTDWLKSVSVSNGVLSIGAATHDTTYLGATASGANTAWNSKDQVSAVTGYSSPTTDSVLGTGSTFSVTDPSVTISSGSTGDVTVATGIGAATTKYLSATASGTAVGANGTANAVTGYANPTTDSVLGSSSTLTVTPSKTYIKATASGANTAWNSKDSKTVLTDSTSLSVTKGN